MDNIFVFIGAGGLAALMVGRMFYRNWKEKKEAEEKFASRRQFTMGKLVDMGEQLDLEPTFVARNGHFAVGHAWSQKKLIFIAATFPSEDDDKAEGAKSEKNTKSAQVAPPASPTAVVTAVDARDLICCEVLEDLFIKTNKTGGKGVAYVRSMDLKINVADPKAPVYILCFLESQVKVGSPEHVEARKTLHLWEGIIKALVHQAGREPDVAEKIAELDLLARQGVVSEEEYKRQKARLLASQFLASGRTQDWTSKLVGGQLREVGKSS